MKIILLEKVEKLGSLGDQVEVKNGYARNYLLPTGKALRATEENIKYFEEKASDLKKNNDKAVKEANKFLDKITEKTFVVIRQAGENGQLFGSVTTRDIANLLKDNGIDQIKKNQVSLLEPIKALGIVDVKVNLHAEVSTTIKINIARTEEEAELQERGKVVSLDESQLDEDAVMDVFDEGVEAELSEEVTDEVNDESSVVNDDKRTDGSDAVVEEKKDELPKLLSIAQASDHLNCSIRTIRYYLYEAKNLPYLILGKEARIRESDLSGFIENLLKGQSSSNKELL